MTAAMDDPYAWFAERGVPRGVADRVHPEAVPIGIRLRLPTLTGETFEQTVIRDDLRGTPYQRADGSTDEWPKYLSQAGPGAIWRPIARPDAPTVLVVEGTKGHLAAAAYAAQDVEVWGIAGCQNWQSGQLALPELAQVAGRRAVVALDGDVSTNHDVNVAARRLGDALIDFGATEVKYMVSGSIGGKHGLDDVLARMPEGQRAARLAGLLANVKDKLPKEPPRKPLTPEPGETDIDDNEMALGSAFAKHFGSVFRFDATTERWLAYSGVWNLDGAGAAMKRAYQVLIGDGGPGLVRPMGVRRVGLMEVPEVKTKWARTAGSRAGAFAFACAMDPIVHFGTWDADPYLFATRTQTLDLRTGTARPNDPADHITRMAGCDWNDSATCPEFDRFLEQALPDADVRSYLQRILGMALLGKVTDHILPVLIGTGRNGKGTLLRIVLAAFGSYGTGVNRTLLIEQRNPGHLTELMTLKGKRLAVVQETKQGGVWDISRINSLTGGDAITARGMHENEQTFQPSHTLVLATNHRPAVPPNESAFWSRYREIPFEVSFEGREDKHLADRIIADELPGVLRWLADGYAAYVTDGLAAPVAVQLADVVARAESNAFALFVNEGYEITGRSEDRVEVTSVWNRWLTYRTNDPEARQCKPNRVRDVLASVASVDGRVSGAGRNSTGRNMLAGLRERPATEANSEATPKLDDPILIDSTSTNEATEATEANHEVVPHETMGEGSNKINNYTRLPAEPCNRVVASVASELQLPVPPGQPLALDIETDDIDHRFSVDPHHYPRLLGVSSGGSYADTAHLPVAGRQDVRTVTTLVADAPLVIGHNIIGFDLPVLAVAVPDAGLDVIRMTREHRIVDTMVVDAVVHPPEHDERPGFVQRALAQYSLDQVAARNGVPGKTDHLPELAAYHGGWGAIPRQNQQYRDYLRGDVECLPALAAALVPAMTPYVWREQRVAAIASTIHTVGVGVDHVLLGERVADTEARRLELKTQLIERYQIPTLKSDGKESDNPAATKGGKIAITRALLGLGVSAADVPVTGTGQLSVSGDAMDALGARYGGAVADLCQVVADMAGIRSIYHTVASNLHGDGRVHPKVAMFQASGRWSLTQPGMTVFGKRGGRVRERAVIQADPGNVFIAADFSQIDARAIAVHSQDHAYLDLFLPGRDSHDEVAALVWGEWDRSSGHHPRRQDAKAIGHGWNYGMGLAKLAMTAGVTDDVAEQFDTTMRQAFTQLCYWRDQIRDLGRSGVVLDNGFGRALHVNPDRAWTQAPALIGQGTARDLAAEGLLRLPDDVAAMLRIQAHDEFVLECRERDAAEVQAELLKAMTFEWAPPHASRPVAIVAEVSKPGRNWAQCYEK